MNTVLDAREDILFSLFYCSFDLVEDAAIKVFDSRGDLYVLERGSLDLNFVNFGKSQAGGREPSRAVVYSPDAFPQYCVLVSNLSDGWFTLVNRLCRQLQVFCVSVRSMGEGAPYPCDEIRVYNGGDVIRCVRAMLDGDRWQFFEKGSLQSFEACENYKERRVRDRLNRQIIIDYLRQSGVELWEADFWTSAKQALFIRENRPVLIF